MSNCCHNRGFARASQVSTAKPIPDCLFETEILDEPGHETNRFLCYNSQTLGSALSVGMIVKRTLDIVDGAQAMMGLDVRRADK